MKKNEEKTWWQENWFWDAYRPLMFDPDRMEDTPKETGEILELMNINPGDYFLDSCCGFGRHSLEMARRGIRVCGVDRQKDYIREADKTAKKEGLDAEFVLENTLEFRRPESFDGAMNYFTSFGYFDDPEEEETAVKNVYDSLKTGGRFLIDIQGKELLARDFKEREWFERNGYKIFLEYKIQDAWTRLENRWMFIPMDGGKLTEIKFTHRIYSALELAELLASCGFSEVNVYGNLKGAPYDEKAERLIAVGIK